MQDLRLAFRNLKSRPAFALGAILTLALGIGANTAMFTVLHGVLLAPLPYRNPDEVVVLNEHTRDFPTLSVTRYNYDDWRARAKSFAGLEAFRSAERDITSAGEPERVPAKMLSAGLLPLLGVSVPEGRAFDASDDRPGAEGVVLLGSAYRKRHFPEGRVGQAAPDRRQAVHGDRRSARVLRAVPARRRVPSLRALGGDTARGPRLASRHLPGGAARARRVAGAGARGDGADRRPARHRAPGLERRTSRVLVTRAHDQLVQNVRPALLMLLGAVALDAADRLCQRREPASGARGGSAEGVGGTGRPRGGPRPDHPPARDREPGAGGGRGAPGPSARRLGSLPSDPHRAAGLPRAASIGVAWPVGLFALASRPSPGSPSASCPALQATRFDLSASLNEEGRGGSGSGVTAGRAPPSWWPRSPWRSCCSSGPAFSCGASPPHPGRPRLPARQPPGGEPPALGAVATETTPFAPPRSRACSIASAPCREWRAPPSLPSSHAGCGLDHPFQPRVAAAPGPERLRHGRLPRGHRRLPERAQGAPQAGPSARRGTGKARRRWW